MKYKKLKKAFKDKKIVSLDNIGLKGNFAKYSKFIFRKDKKDMVVECLNRYNRYESLKLTKGIYQDIVYFAKKTNFKVYKNKRITENSPEKLMKIAFFPELAFNYPDSSIVSEFTHKRIKARPDFAVFSAGECHVFELKSEQDNLVKLKKQIKEYKKFATTITVVLHQKHFKKFNDMHYKDINLIIYTGEEFQVKEMYYRNEIKKNISTFIWYKEKENLFKRLKNNSTVKLPQKFKYLQETVDMNNLTYRVLEERFKNHSNETRISVENMFSRKEVEPADKNLTFYFDIDKDTYLSNIGEKSEKDIDKDKTKTK